MRRRWLSSLGAGFHKSRVSDIAREADVADGTIYLYFKGKDDILISIFEETMSEMIERAEEVVAGEGDPLDRLHRFCGQPHGERRVAYGGGEGALG